MRVIVAGCGRVGAAVASALDDGGHDVVVVDKEPKAFRRLPEGFRGRTVHGIVFDRVALERADVESADALVAVTSGDNSNVVAARTARERYGVPTVVARIYDPDRAVIYERHGIATIAAARWTSERILAELLPSDELEGAVGAGDGDVLLMGFAVPEGTEGIPVERFAVAGRCALVAVTRDGRTTIPPSHGLVGAGDRVHLAVERSAVEQVRAHVEGVGEEAVR